MDGVAEQPRSHKQQKASEDEAGLERDVPEDGVEARVFRQEAFHAAEDLGADCEDGDVRPDDDEEERIGKRVDVKSPVADRLGSTNKPDRENQPDDEADDAGIKKQPARAVEQKESQVTPAITPGAQMGCACAAVGRKCSRNLGQAQKDLNGIEAAGVSMKEVTDKLLVDGLASFQKSFETLISGLEKKTKSLGRELVASR